MHYCLQSSELFEAHRERIVDVFAVRQDMRNQLQGVRVVALRVVSKAIDFVKWYSASLQLEALPSW